MPRGHKKKKTKVVVPRFSMFGPRILRDSLMKKLRESQSFLFSKDHDLSFESKSKNPNFNIQSGYDIGWKSVTHTGNPPPMPNLEGKNLK
jgi:hypothetical protein